MEIKTSISLGIKVFDANGKLNNSKKRALIAYLNKHKITFKKLVGLEIHATKRLKYSEIADYINKIGG